MISKTPYFDAIDSANCFIGERATGSLHSGAGAYTSAIVVSAHPFIMMSDGGSMLWRNKDRESVDIECLQECESLRFRRALESRRDELPKVNDDHPYKPLLLADYFIKPDVDANKDLYASYSFSTDNDFVKASIYVEPDLAERNTRGTIIVGVSIYKTPYYKNWLITVDGALAAYLAVEGRRWLMPVDFREAATAINLQQHKNAVLEIPVG